MRINLEMWNGAPLRHRILIRLAAVVMVLGFSLPAMASLGGNLTSIQADTSHMRATVNEMGSDNYQVEQLKSPAGTVVNEYLSSSSGTVFAVTWHGQFMPDMEQILGSYFQQYSEALASQPREYGHHPLNIQLPGLV
ncbi:MAG TPA: DUF2844 domain-containing protein, partial [Terriglobia bacterium]|nr:DUF2844 domain-containing protein [Terriglobia bacterium]